MQASSPVFIVGEARSGSSLLYRTLQKHPSFRPKVQNLVETEAFAHLRRTFLFSLEYPVALRRFMLDDPCAYAAFLRSIRPARVASALAAPVNYLLRDPATWWWLATLNHLVLRSFFFYAWQARGCPRLVEKTPTNILHLAKLTRTFPAGRFLYIHRHPVDVFTSYRRRAAVDPGAGWANLTLERFCSVYQHRTRLALDWAGRHENLHLVRYEQLTGNPPDAFRTVCSFLNEPYAAEALEEPAPDSDRWPVDPHLWGGIVRQTKQWRHYLSGTETAALQERLAGVMAALGYEPHPAS
jgi:Sulfotransferase family